MTEKTLARLALEVHETAREKGWWDEPRSDYECICLMHSELSEAVEALRDGGLPWQNVFDVSGRKKPVNLPKPEGWVVELADCLIRMLDFMEYKQVSQDFYDCLIAKMEYNKTRPYRHGNKKA